MSHASSNPSLPAALASTAMGRVLVLLLACFSLCASRSCPSYWHKYRGFCYVFVKEATSWLTAQTACQLLKARLAEVTSPGENTFVKNLMDRKKAKNVWLGMNDLVKDGQWVLTSSGSRLPYTNWAKNEPNNGKGRGQNCLQMTADGFWDDDDCVKLHSFICEKKL